MNYNFNMSKIYMNKLEAKIKELEEQLTMLVKDDEEYQETIIKLSKRINKAIEYCEKELNDERSLENQWLMGCYDTCKELLDILKGSDN